MSRLARAVSAALVLAAAGFGGTVHASPGSTAAGAGSAAPSCPAAWRAAYQRLANRIGAPVYCPGWMPQPLTGEIGPHVSFAGAGGSSLSVDRDGSYLAFFTWLERGSGEVHVNLRGYPHRTRIPTCIGEDTSGGKLVKSTIPCFADVRGTVRANGIRATVYAVNQDADMGHVLYAWRYAGGLYTISEHVAPPFGREGVVANLDRLLGSLVLIQPRRG